MATEEDTCGDLIIALSKEVDKEFQHLKFLSTSSQGRLVDTSFISEQGYRDIQKSEIRKEMCNKHIQVFAAICYC